MQEDAADALVGYPRSHLEAVADFLAGQYQRDAVGPLLGASADSDADASAGAADAAAAAASSGSMLDLVLEVLGQQAVQAADSSAVTSPVAGAQAAGAFAAAASGGSSGGAAVGGGASVGQLLSGLHAACCVAFDATSQLISPTLAQTGSLALGPPPSALAAGYQPGGAAVAVAWEGRPQVLLLRGAGEGGEGAAGLEAALLALPEGAAAADLGFYRGGQLALLLAGGSDPPRLLLLPQEQLDWSLLSADLLADSDALQLAGLLAESAGGAPGGSPLPQEAARQRTLPYPHAQAPLAVSASRGVGCVLAGTQVRLAGGGRM